MGVWRKLHGLLSPWGLLTTPLSLSTFTFESSYPTKRNRVSPFSSGAQDPASLPPRPCSPGPPHLAGKRTPVCAEDSSGITQAWWGSVGPETPAPSDDTKEGLDAAKQRFTHTWPQGNSGGCPPGEKHVGAKRAAWMPWHQSPPPTYRRAG